MAIGSNSSGSQTCTVGTEHTLATISGTPGGFKLHLDLANLADGATPDELEIRVYGKVRSTDTERLRWPPIPLRGAQGVPYWESPPVDTDNYVRFSIKQTQGTGRAIPWNVLVFA